MNVRDVFLLSPLDIDGGSVGRICETLASCRIMPPGLFVADFERVLSEFTKIPYCLALSSGTAALNVLLAHMGIKSGDIVIASDLTFIASVSYAHRMGAELRFVDSRFDDWNMDPSLLRLALSDCKREGKLPRVVIVTDLYGQCADYDGILTVCDSFGVPVISDSCEALGATYKGRQAGYDSLACALSFNYNKLVTTLGGGALLSHDEGLIKHARRLSAQAREDCDFYEHKEVGFNYRMSDICAAVGIGQMESIKEKLKKKRYIFDFYKRHLSGLEGRISFMPQMSCGRQNCWLTVIRSLSLRAEDVLLVLRNNGIEGRRFWKPMHLQPVFKGSRFYGGNVGETLFAHGLCLPSGTVLTDAQLEIVCSCLNKIFV